MSTMPTIRRTVAGHPVATMLLAMFAANFGLLVPAAAAGLALEPFLLAVTLIGYVLPAVLITAARGGRPAVRELFGRVFRWRVNAGWYLLALLGLPAATVLGTAALFGPDALHALLTSPVLLGYVSTLSIFPVVNLWEETAWMDMVQAPLTKRHGAVLAAVITGPFFGLQHVALHIGEPLGQAVTSLVFLSVAGIAFRLLLGWLYSATGSSILLVAILHATWNATNNNLLPPAIAPQHAALVSLVSWMVIGVAVLAIGVATRGRFVRTPGHTAGAGTAPNHLANAA